MEPLIVFFGPFATLMMNTKKNAAPTPVGPANKKARRSSEAPTPVNPPASELIAQAENDSNTHGGDESIAEDLTVETQDDADESLMDVCTNIEMLHVAHLNPKSLNVLIAHILAFQENFPTFQKLVKARLGEIIVSARHRRDDPGKPASLRLSEGEEVWDIIPDVPHKLLQNYTKLLADIAKAFPDFDTRSNRWVGPSSNKLRHENPGVLLLKDTPTPYLSGCDHAQLVGFYQTIRNIHASEIACDLDRWIVGPDVRARLYWLLLAQRIVTHEDEFDAMLEDVDSFIDNMTRYFSSKKSPDGDRSARTKVYEDLRFTITDFLDSEQQTQMIHHWSNFESANEGIIANVDNVDQIQLINALIETNMSLKATAAQKLLFGKLKDLPKSQFPTTLRSAFTFLVNEFTNIRDHCVIAHAAGYRLPLKDSISFSREVHVTSSTKSLKPAILSSSFKC